LIQRKWIHSKKVEGLGGYIAKIGVDPNQYFRMEHDPALDELSCGHAFSWLGKTFNGFADLQPAVAAELSRRSRGRAIRLWSQVTF
jgi:hypothetical protein